MLKAVVMWMNTFEYMLNGQPFVREFEWRPRGVPTKGTPVGSSHSANFTNRRWSASQDADVSLKDGLNDSTLYWSGSRLARPAWPARSA